MRKPAETIFEIEDAPDDSAIEPSDDRDDEREASSWTIESGTTAIKKTDRPIFQFRETIIPRELRDFFAIGDLSPGQKRKIRLWYNNQPFEAFIEKTVHPTPLTRMMWKPDLAEVLRAQFPEWREVFKKSLKEPADTPSIFFTRKHQPDQYEMELEGAPGACTTPAHASPAHHAPAHGSAPVSPDSNAPPFHVPLKPGDVIDNETLTAIFRCSPHGEMRPSPHTNILVLVSDHTKSVFEDTWVNNFFQYTGTGLTGKHALSARHNRVLAESKTNGTSLYLFEVFEEGAYVFDGEAELSDRPFLSRQTDREKNVRDVYIFPLRLKGQKRPPVPKKERLKLDVLVTGEAPVRGRRISSPPHAEPGIPAQEPLTEGKRTGFVSPDQEPYPAGKRPGLPAQGPLTTGKRPGLPAQGPLTTGKRPGLPAQEPLTAGRRAMLPAQEPLTAGRRPGLPAQEPLAAGKRPRLPAGEQDLNVPGYAKRRARGTCQLCEKPAPFRTRDGEPYLETHHIDPLAVGEDVIENTVALCPNCHRKMHALNLPADVRVLKSRALVKI